MDIYLNFIGKFGVNLNLPTPEELAAEEEEQKKREQHREAQRRYMDIDMMYSFGVSIFMSFMQQPIPLF